MRAARANRDFCADEERIRAEITVMIITKQRVGRFIQDHRLRADGFIIRAQSAIRADGFSSAQYRNSAKSSGGNPVATHKRHP
ncbi:MAG: hypothetical protein IH606_18000 [Burkholderiales bacterium]|nr:hypothetical protein [Burkholderiales bacterium]